MLQCWNRNILFNLYGYLKSDGNEYKLDISSSYGNKLNLIDKLRLLLLVKRNELIELFPLLILCCNKKINHILVEVKLSIKHYEQQKLYKYTKVSKPRIKDLHKKTQQRPFRCHLCEKLWNLQQNHLHIHFISDFMGIIVFHLQYYFFELSF